MRTAAPVPRPDWAYFFDIDGTLVELAESPERVRVDRAMREQLEALHAWAGGAVALISGRAIQDIDALMNGVRFPAAGQHGTERRDAAGRTTHHPASLERLEWARTRLAGAVARHPGLLLEAKGHSLALHYRRAPRLAGYAHRLMRSLLPRLGGEFCLQPGKRIVELKPAGRDKGGAVLEFLKEPPFQGRAPVFVGDDLTDEFGFATVNRLHGASIKVGAGPTAARYRLRDVAAVRAWLAQTVTDPSVG